MIEALKRRRWAVVVAVGALAASGAAAYAAVPDSNGVIHGCIGKNGQLSVIDSATQACKKSETPLSWSQAGPQGPMGPAGPQGPQGPQGPAGSSGVTGWEMVQFAFNLPDGDPGTGQIAHVDCSPGKKVLGGGVTLDSFRDSVVRYSGPYDAGKAWTVHIQQTSEEGDTTARVWAICANV